MNFVTELSALYEHADKDGRDYDNDHNNIGVHDAGDDDGHNDDNYPYLHDAYND